MEYTPTSRTACYKTSDQVLCVNIEVLKQLKPRRVSYTNFNRSCFLHQNSRLTCIFVEFDYCILVIFIYSLIVIILVKFNAHSLVMSPLEAIASKHCPHYRYFFRLLKTYFNAPPKLLIFSVDFLFFFKNAIKHYCFSAIYFIFINWLHVWCLQDKLFCLFCQNLIKCTFIISLLNRVCLTSPIKIVPYCKHIFYKSIKCIEKGL